MNTLHTALRELEKRQVLHIVHGVGIFVKEAGEHNENSTDAAAHENRDRKTGSIGLIASMAYQMPKNPFHIRLMGAITQAVTASQQHLLYLGTEHNWDVEALHKVDGVLILGSEELSPILQKVPPEFPVISLLAVAENVDSVGIDEYQAGHLAARHLLKAGHRRIACLMEKRPLECRRRFAGISDALLEADIEVETDWLRLTDKVYGSHRSWKTDQPYREWACEEMADWLQNDWEETGCTALIVQNEIAAIGAIQVMQAAGVRVPEEVSVITFDGTDLCDLISPHISAVALPLEQIGIKAVEVLNRCIEQGKSKEVQAVVLPLHLRPGGSVHSLEAEQHLLVKSR